MPDFIPTSGLGPGGEPVTSTTSQLTPSSHSDYSRKQLSDEAAEAFRRQREAEDEYLRSIQGLPPVSTPSALDAAAEAKSKEGSRIAMERADVADQPDPFQPVAPPPTMMGKPIMAPIQAKPTSGPRPYTSQEFNASTEGGPGGVDVLTGKVQPNADKLPAMAGGIKGPQTIAEAKDESAAYAAYEKEKIAAERLKAEKEMAAEKAKREQAAYARVNELAAQVEKDRDALFEKPGTFSTILGAIAQALGAYGAGLTRGPNWAAEIIKNGQEQDLQAKKMSLEASLEKMKAAGAAPQHIEAWAKAQQERLVATEKAQIDAVEKRTMAMLAPFPQARAAVVEQMAKLKAEQAQKTAEFVQKSTEQTISGGKSNEGVKQTVTEARIPPGQQPGGSVTESEAKKAQYAKGILDSVDTIKKGHQLTDKELRTLNENVQSMRAQVEQATRGIAKPFWNSSLQKAGILPETFTQGLSDEAKVVANAWLNATGLVIRDQSGAAITNAEDFTNAQKKMIQPGDGPKTRAEKLRILESDGESMERLAGKQAYYRLHGKMPDWDEQPTAETKKPADTGKPAASEPAAKPRTAKDITGRLSAEDREAKKWAEAHPGDPDAKNILDGLRKKVLGRK